MDTRILKIKDIQVIDKLYPRREASQSIILSYAKAMKDGDRFPPPMVAYFEKKYILVDGKHRLEALQTNGEQYAMCEINSKFKDEQDIYLAAVKANLTHGYRLNSEDKMRIALTMKDMKFDTQDIARLLHIDMNNVDKIQNIKITKKVIFERAKAGEIKPVIQETNPPRETISIIDKETEQIEVLENFIDFITHQQLKTENKKIKEYITTIIYQLNLIIE